MKTVAYLLLLAAIFCLPFDLCAQAEESDVIQLSSLKGSSTSKNTSSDTDEEKPYVVVEVMPSFPGGEAEMIKFISENLHYPDSARHYGIQGRVTARFVVNKDGTVSDINILRGIDNDCDKEVVRVISLMPKWEPGKQNGKNIRVYYMLPIIFSLNSDKD